MRVKVPAAIRTGMQINKMSVNIHEEQFNVTPIVVFHCSTAGTFPHNNQFISKHILFIRPGAVLDNWTLVQCILAFRQPWL